MSNTLSSLFVPVRLQGCGGSGHVKSSSDPLTADAAIRSPIATVWRARFATEGGT